ncbi:MAG: nucleotide exchange factor GrpE [Candidatus Levyibacteriota bacterium]
MKDDANKKKNEEVEELKKKLEDLENQIKIGQDNYKRVLADYQNLEKRVEKEKKEWIVSANKDIILRLLPVLDTLIMAQIHVGDEGLNLSIQHFLDVLKSEGVEKVETVGKEFNPHTMDCVEVIEGEEGKVLEEVRAGYLISGKALRPAMVKVGK